MERPGRDRGRSRTRAEAVVAAVGGRRARAVVVNAFILALAVAALAVAQDTGNGNLGSAASRERGDAVELGRRNPIRRAVGAETALVANAGGSRLALRLTNTASGGRANSSTCTNNGTAPTDGCHVYVNKGNGIVASFRSAGNGVAPFAVRETNDGRVDNLNSHYVNGNQVACPDGTQLIAGICAETAIRDGGQVNWTTAHQTCLAADRRLPSVGESALIAKVVGPQTFGTGNWSDDTGRNSTNATAAIVLPAGQTAQINQTDGVQFRCVTSPITPKPQTPQAP